jgi:hypothetical protein
MEDGRFLIVFSCSIHDYSILEKPLKWDCDEEKQDIAFKKKKE